MWLLGRWRSGNNKARKIQHERVVSEKCVDIKFFCQFKSRGYWPW